MALLVRCGDVRALAREGEENGCHNGLRRLQSKRYFFHRDIPAERVKWAARSAVSCWCCVSCVVKTASSHPPPASDMLSLPLTVFVPRCHWEVGFGRRARQRSDI